MVEPSGIRGCDCQKEDAQQRECDSDRTNQQILPGRFQRSMMPMKVNQRGAGQRRCLDRYPKQCELLADGHQRHRGQEEEETTGEARLARVREEEAFFEIAMRPAAFLTQVRNGIETGGQKQHAGQRFNQSPQAHLPRANRPRPARAGQAMSSG